VIPATRAGARCGRGIEGARSARRGRLALLAALLLAVAGGPTRGDQDFVHLRVMTPELALDLARETLAACREAGYQTAVAVTDRSGVVQALLRDRYAGPHTPDSATRKAWTAVSFRTDTLDLAEVTAAGREASGIRFLPGVLMMGGGMVVWSRGEMVGGLGVSGAPGGQADHECAAQGLAATLDRLELF
jgi:uncharacterized protein GlcG (DUF336 family)